MKRKLYNINHQKKVKITTLKKIVLIVEKKFIEMRYDAKNAIKTFFKKPSNRKTKINWPSIEELETQLKLVSFTTLGKELGISDNAIRKHIKKHN